MEVSLSKLNTMTYSLFLAIPYHCSNIKIYFTQLIVGINLE